MMTYYGHPRMDTGIGCVECDWTGYLEFRDERGLTVTCPCDCRRKPEPPADVASTRNSR
jgi:hypothetical protein